MGRPRRSRLARLRDAHHRGPRHQDRRPHHAVPHVADRLRGHSRLDHLEGRQLRAVRAEHVPEAVAHPLQRERAEAGRGGGLRHLGRGAGGALGHHPRRRPGDPHHAAVDSAGDQRPGGALGAQPLLLEGGPGRAATALHRRHPDHPERRHRGVQPEGDRRRGRLGHHHDQLRLPARLQGERGTRQLHRLADSRRRRGPRLRVQPHLQG